MINIGVILEIPRFLILRVLANKEIYSLVKDLQMYGMRFILSVNGFESESVQSRHPIMGDS